MSGVTYRRVLPSPLPGSGNELRRLMPMIELSPGGALDEAFELPVAPAEKEAVHHKGLPLPVARPTTTWLGFVSASAPRFEPEAWLRV